MQDSEHASPQALRRLCDEAGKQAWRLSPDAECHAMAPRSTFTALRVGGVALLASGVAAALQFGPPGVSSPARSAAPAPAAAVPTAVVPAAIVPTASARPAEPVRWQGSELLIAFEQVPLPQAITLLARVTDTTVNGAHLLQAAAPVTLHLRTNDVTNAWRHLLQGHAAYSTSCSGSACQVWIGRAIAAAAGSAAPGVRQTVPDGQREAPADVTDDESRSQPDGSC